MDANKMEAAGTQIKTINQQKQWLHARSLMMRGVQPEKATRICL
jgi:hypothetical protein